MYLVSIAALPLLHKQILGLTISTFYPVSFRSVSKLCCEGLLVFMAYHKLVVGDKPAIFKKLFIAVNRSQPTKQFLTTTDQCGRAFT